MMMMSYLIYILPFFFTFFYLFKSTQPTTTNPPPSPPKLPIIGNLHQLGPLIHRSFSSLSQRYGGGHLMLLHLGSAPSLVVSSAAAAQEIMQTHDLIFSTRPPIQMHKTLFYDLKEIAAAPYGEYWRQAKKLIILNFLSSKKVQTFSRVREEEIAITIRKVAKISESNKAVNLGDLLFEFSNGVSCRATFGKKYDKESGKKLKRVVSKMFEVLSRFNYADLIPQLAWIDQISGANGKVEAVAKDVDEFMEVAIEERLAGRKQTDDHEVGEGVEPFIEALLRIQKDGVDGISFNRDNVKALLLDSYVGATETSSSVLEWVMAELLTHPQALEKVQAEVRTIVNNDKQHITDEDLEQMKYLKAVIMEATRLHPPIPMPLPRFATQDVKIMGYDISKGTRVYINIWAIGRDPKVWDRPDEFVPERFVEASVDDFKSIPFGGGRRRCPGKGSAMAMIEGFLANLLCKFDWELKDKENVNMDETVGISNHPKSSFLAFATPFSS